MEFPRPRIALLKESTNKCPPLGHHPSVGRAASSARMPGKALVEKEAADWKDRQGMPREAVRRSFLARFF